MALAINAKVYSRFSPGETAFVMEGNKIKPGIITQVQMVAIAKQDGSLNTFTVYYLDSIDAEKQLSRTSSWKEEELFESREELIETL